MTYLLTTAHPSQNRLTLLRTFMPLTCPAATRPITPCLATALPDPSFAAPIRCASTVARVGAEMMPREEGPACALLGPLKGPDGRRMKDLSGLEVTVPVMGHTGGGTACRAQVEHARDAEAVDGAMARRRAVNMLGELYGEGRTS